MGGERGGGEWVGREEEVSGERERRRWDEERVGEWVERERRR